MTALNLPRKFYNLDQIAKYLLQKRVLSSLAAFYEDFHDEIAMFKIQSCTDARLNLACSALIV